MLNTFRPQLGVQKILPSPHTRGRASPAVPDIQPRGFPLLLHGIILPKHHRLVRKTVTTPSGAVLISHQQADSGQFAEGPAGSPGGAASNGSSPSGTWGTSQRDDCRQEAKARLRDVREGSMNGAGRRSKPAAVDPRDIIGQTQHFSVIDIDRIKVRYHQPCPEESSVLLIRSKYEKLIFTM
jgi:hypothetical protein